MQANTWIDHSCIKYINKNLFKNLKQEGSQQLYLHVYLGAGVAYTNGQCESWVDAEGPSFPVLIYCLLDATAASSPLFIPELGAWAFSPPLRGGWCQNPEVAQHLLIATLVPPYLLLPTFPKSCRQLSSPEVWGAGNTTTQRAPFYQAVPAFLKEGHKDPLPLCGSSCG